MIPLSPADTISDNLGAPRCADGAGCAERAGEMMWGAYPGNPDPAGSYCCTDPLCNHPREQVFNGGACERTTARDVHLVPAPA